MNSINIKNPCHENWEDMTPVEKNRFCQSCKKIVVDFEAMSDEEVIDYLNKRKGQRTCGRFTNIQLNRINQKINAERPKEKESTSLIKSILTAILLVATTSIQMLSQKRMLEKVTQIVQILPPKREDSDTSEGYQYKLRPALTSWESYERYKKPSVNLMGGTYITQAKKNDRTKREITEETATYEVFRSMSSLGMIHFPINPYSPFWELWIKAKAILPNNRSYNGRKIEKTEQPY